MKKWQVTVGYSSKGKSYTFSSTVWAKTKSETIGLIVDAVKATRPNVDVQLTFAVEYHVPTT